ncbi:hypothetical protein B0T26DRAFT_494543 [Lasiosphaeria miniovina]|uniref:Uncharacterized protein n=1 Tax=Lasiosphaeria miniovina TaxID=1954250 RepID=A0AA40DH44_9PEZI|nr:uncharacterized protein B0T26DRAFT_494543 [Lasiosphaeria miniovina]KAK0703294.1 hypothetical protein B0T26DRAFT_494543 [Lasiosphaeria miniovina]
MLGHGSVVLCEDVKKSLARKQETCQKPARNKKVASQRQSRPRNKNAARNPQKPSQGYCKHHPDWGVPIGEARPSCPGRGNVAHLLAALRREHGCGAADWVPGHWHRWVQRTLAQMGAEDIGTDRCSQDMRQTWLRPGHRQTWLRLGLRPGHVRRVVIRRQHGYHGRRMNLTWHRHTPRSDCGCGNATSDRGSSGVGICQAEGPRRF